MVGFSSSSHSLGNIYIYSFSPPFQVVSWLALMAVQSLCSSSTWCSKHPQQPVVGVCASCLRERLAAASPSPSSSYSVAALLYSPPHAPAPPPQQLAPPASLAAGLWRSSSQSRDLQEYDPPLVNLSRFNLPKKKITVALPLHPPPIEDVVATQSKAAKDPPPLVHSQSIRRSGSFSEGRKDQHCSETLMNRELEHQKEEGQTKKTLISSDEAETRRTARTFLRESEDGKIKDVKEPAAGGGFSSLYASSFTTPSVKQEKSKKTEEFREAMESGDHSIIPRSWEEARLSWDEGMLSWPDKCTSGSPSWEHARSSSCDGSFSPWQALQDIPFYPDNREEESIARTTLLSCNLQEKDMVRQLHSKDLGYNDNCSAPTRRRAFIRHDINAALLRSEIENALMRQKEMALKQQQQQFEQGFSIPAGYARSEESKQYYDPVVNHHHIAAVSQLQEPSPQAGTGLSKIWHKLAMNPMRSAFRHRSKEGQVLPDSKDETVTEPCTARKVPDGHHIHPAFHKYSMWSAYCSPLPKDKSPLPKRKDENLDKTRNVNSTNVDNGLLRFYLTPLRTRASARHIRTRASAGVTRGHMS